MNDKILPMTPTYDETDTPSDEILHPFPAPKPHIIYQYTPTGSNPPSDDDLPTYRFDDEIMRPHATDIPSFTRPSDWTPVALFHAPALLRDEHGVLRYTYPDGTFFSANDIMRHCQLLDGVSLQPIP